MTYVVNPDGSVTFVKSVKEAAQAKADWADYAKDLNKKENS